MSPGTQSQFGFLGWCGCVPTNVGSGGDVQPLAIVHSGLSVGKAVKQTNAEILEMAPAEVLEVFEMQKQMAPAERFTYLLGPIEIALGLRLITLAQFEALTSSCAAMWSDGLFGFRAAPTS